MVDVLALGLTIGPPLVAATGAVLHWSRVKSKTVNLGWESLASNHGFEITKMSLFRGPRIYGKLFSHDVRFIGTAGTKRWGGSTRFELTFEEPLHMEMRLLPQTDTSDADYDVDEKIGRRRFDSRVIIDTPDPKKVKGFLTAKRRRAVRRFFGRYPNSEINRTGLEITVPRLIHKREELEEFLKEAELVLWELVTRAANYRKKRS